MQPILRRAIKAMATGTVAGVMAAGGAMPVGAGPERSDDAGLRAMRAFTQRYQSKTTALSGGFTATTDCVPAMGYHYVNVSRIGHHPCAEPPEVVLMRAQPTSGFEAPVGRLTPNDRCLRSRWSPPSDEDLLPR